MATAEKNTGLNRKVRAEIETQTPDYTAEVTVERTGTQIVVPETMTIGQAIEALKKRAEEEEQMVNIFEPINTYPMDGVHAMVLVLKEMFGWVGLKPPAWFETNIMANVETGPTTSIQVPWGKFQVPGMEGVIQPSLELRDGVIRFVITGAVKRKHERLIKEIADKTRERVRTHSLYRGKAIRLVFPDLESQHFSPATHAPRFIDTSAVKPSELILPRETEAVLQAALWAPIVASDLARASRVPLKRGVLLEGTFGTGKTMTANVTAKIAEEHNWTFIYLENPEQLAAAIRFAKMYEPAVIFTEDVDRADDDDEDDSGRSDLMNEILNVIDGVEMKGAEVIVVATTNNVQSISPSLLRPGRLDAVVSFLPPDAEAVERLIRMYAHGMLPEGENLSSVCRVLQGNIPSTVREVVERSKLAAIWRLHQASSSEALVLSAADLEVAATGMLAHLSLLRPKVEDKRSDIEKAADIVADALSSPARRSRTTMRANGNEHQAHA